MKLNCIISSVTPLNLFNGDYLVNLKGLPFNYIMRCVIIPPVIGAEHLIQTKPYTNELYNQYGIDEELIIIV